MTRDLRNSDVRRVAQRSDRELRALSDEAVVVLALFGAAPAFLDDDLCFPGILHVTFWNVARQSLLELRARYTRARRRFGVERNGWAMSIPLQRVVWLWTLRSLVEEGFAVRPAWAVAADAFSGIDELLALAEDPEAFSALTGLAATWDGSASALAWVVRMGATSRIRLPVAVTA